MLGSLHICCRQDFVGKTGIRTGLVLILSVQLAVDLLVYFTIRRSIALSRVVIVFLKC